MIYVCYKVCLYYSIRKILWISFSDFFEYNFFNK